MPKYQIEFSDISPTAVEVRFAESLDVNGIEIPADAMQFTIRDENLNWQAPTYFATDDLEVGSIADMKARHGIEAVFLDEVEEFRGASECALVVWCHPVAPEWYGKILVPLVEGVSAIYDRKLRKVVWPPAG